MFKEVQSDMSFYRSLLPDKKNSTCMRFFNNGNTAVVKDLHDDVETVVVVNKRTKNNFVSVATAKGSKTFEVPVSELKEFLELDFRFKLNHDENPQNLKAFVGEIPIVYGLLD